MNIYIVGLPKSGRTTIAKKVAEDLKYNYIDAGQIKNAFREQDLNEHPQQYKETYNNHLTSLLKEQPYFITDYIGKEYDKQGSELIHNIIDGIQSPKDFTSLFDYNRDVVVFLNRTNNEAEYEDYENIGVSVMRDYCFWLSASSLLPRNRWIEYNFQIPGEPSDALKVLGSKNTVYIVRSISKLISHMKENLPCLTT